VETSVNEQDPLLDRAVDASRIEAELAQLWRAQQHKGVHAMTKAALWNVVAHTASADDHAFANEVLSRASARVPQRSILVKAEPHTGEGELTSSISANCHLIGGSRQVCSEEIAIAASGEGVNRVPPLVSSLLLPDMPVGVWWIGDLRGDGYGYVETLLEPADRLIVDSGQFSGPGDLELVSRIGEQTTTAPADLNWARIEEWRSATAALFDPEPMRKRLRTLRRIRVVSGGGSSFADTSQALLYIGWLMGQTGMDVAFELASDGEERGIACIELHDDGNTTAQIRRSEPRGMIVASSGDRETSFDCITRPLAQKTEDLIVRLLKRPEADRVYLRTLKTLKRSSS
jgi:glucose-6-phosphate dehydrogenase assembly protein OpcA